MGMLRMLIAPLRRGMFCLTGLLPDYRDSQASDAGPPAPCRSQLSGSRASADTMK